MRINLTSVLVDDQAKALAFYTKVLGFEKKEDVDLGALLGYQFERDLHRHVHLENNVLFPRAIALEAQVSRKLHCEAPLDAREVER